jgi:cobalt-zinc-cadmium resistance protein CzcA
MAQTVILALAGATFLSHDVRPALVAMLLSGKVQEKESFLFRLAKRSTSRRSRGAAPCAAVVVGAGAARSVRRALGLGAARQRVRAEADEGALAMQPRASRPSA